MRQFIVPLKIIQEHLVTRCEDCEYFENLGGSYGEYHACHNWDRSTTDLHRQGYDIPEDCPMLPENNKNKDL